MSDESNRPQLPEPWYYKPQNIKHLYLPLRAARNLLLIFAFSVGVLWLLGAQVVLVLYLFAPDQLSPYLSQYPAAFWGPLWGFAAGVAAAGFYKVRFPGNPKAPKVLIPMGTGLGGLIGGAYGLGGQLALEVALLFCFVGVTGYAYVEGLPRKEES